MRGCLSKRAVFNHKRFNESMAMLLFIGILRHAQQDNESDEAQRKTTCQLEKRGEIRGGIPG